MSISTNLSVDFNLTICDNTKPYCNNMEAKKNCWSNHANYLLTVIHIADALRENILAYYMGYEFTRVCDIYKRTDGEYFLH